MIGASILPMPEDTVQDHWWYSDGDQVGAFGRVEFERAVVRFVGRNTSPQAASGHGRG